MPADIIYAEHLSPVNGAKAEGDDLRRTEGLRIHYLRKHMGDALLQLETSGKLKVAENKTDGKKRRAKTFPNEALVTLL